MKRILLLTMTLFILAGINSLNAQIAGTTIFDQGSTWTYLDDGSNQTPAWYQVDYDDGAWASGPAPLGFGSIGPDIATTVSFGPDENNKYTTTYFRTKFDYTLAGDEVNYIFNFIVDDGAVFYLNGVECARFNMPEGDIKFTDFSVEYGPEDWGEWLVVDKEHIVDGENVLCVEVHQGDLTSSDLGFEMEIVVNTGDIIPANTYFVTSPSDDAEEEVITGEMDLGSSDLELATDGSTAQLVGMRFSNLVIDKGATITSASIQFTSKGNYDGAVNLKIEGEKNAESVAFDTAAFDISQRTRTIANVSWSPPDWTPDAGDAQKTPDLSTIVQEIIDLEGWASGNPITFIITGIDGAYRNSYAKYGGAAPTLNVVAEAGPSAIQSVDDNLISVYPNPAENVFYISNPTSDMFSYKVRSITGQLIDQGDHLSGNRASVHLSQSGLYIVEIRCADKVYTHKVIMK